MKFYCFLIMTLVIITNPFFSHAMFHASTIDATLLDPPVERLPAKKKLKKVKRKRQLKKKRRFRNIRQTKKTKAFYITLIAIGVLLFLLSILLLVLLIPTIGATTGLVSVFVYLGWIFFVLTQIAAFYFIFFGILLLPRATAPQPKKVPTTTITKKELLAASNENHPHLPETARTQYVALQLELAEMKKETQLLTEERLKVDDFEYGTIKKKITIQKAQIAAKKETIEQFEKLDQELADIPPNNRSEYADLITKNWSLTQQKKTLLKANSEIDQKQIDTIQQAINNNLEQLKTLRK